MNNILIQTSKSSLIKFNFNEPNQNYLIDKKLLDDCIEDVKNSLEIKPTIKIYDKIVHQRRDVGFFSDTSIGYYYSNQLAKSKPLTLHLDLLLTLINELFSSNFNGILINRYNDGNDYIGAHSDDEKNLDKAGVVAISVGEQRIFRIRDKYTKKIINDIVINDLDCIHMKGDFQKEFTHEIPISKNNVGVRYSFTFRNHKI